MEKKTSTTTTTKYVSIDPYSMQIETRAKWYERIWVLLSNPFLYLFKGKIRY